MALLIDQPTANEWYVLKGDTQYGPYSYEEMIRMLQKNMLFDFDYSWCPHLDTWTPISDLPEFSPDRIIRLVEKEMKAQQEQEQPSAAPTAQPETVFHKRLHERVLVNIPVLCTDNSRLWNGKCENLSVGGALIYMENPLLLPGHLVTVHFRAVRSTDQCFNTTGEVLSKRLTKKRIEHDTGIYYVLKFLQLTSIGERQLKGWVKENSKRS